ncbi:MAG TPA: ABC transporter permease subunit [Candidatus Lustribacter sp.]|nr:ABC transporter permease subunit [Candidatus Lustribacter sp.]
MSTVTLPLDAALPRAGLAAAVRSELRKFFTTRMWWGMAIGVFLAGGLFALLFALLAGSTAGGGAGSSALPDLSDPQMVSTVYTGGLSVGYLLTLAVGVLTIGSEYRHKTISSTFLSTPHRARVMGAKVISLLVIGAFYGLVSLTGSFGVGATVIAIKGFSPAPDGGQLVRTMGLSLLVLGLWALIGLGVGILIPNQIVAILVAVGAAWIVEPLAGLALSFVSWGAKVVPYLPSQATSAMVEQVSQSDTVRLLSWWGGALVLTGYAAVMAVVGTWLTLRRDVT